MNIKILLAACCILSTAAMSLASTSIAKECYDKNQQFASNHTTNNNYLTYMIVMGVVCIITSFIMMYMGSKALP
jgi:hypothetical protein